MFRNFLAALLLVSCLIVDPSMAFAQTGPGVNYTNIIQRPGLRMQTWGDSEESFAAVNAVAGTPVTGREYGYTGANEVVWLKRFMGTMLNFDLSKGYGPVLVWNSAFRIQITNPGLYTSPPTGATVSGGCSTYVTLGTPVMNANNGIASIPITAENPAGACTLGTAVTITGGTATIPATGVVLNTGGGTLAVPGITACQAVQWTLADATAANVDVLSVHIGTNDISLNTPLATVEGCLTTIFQAILSSGKSVIYWSVSPRDQSSATAAQQKQIYALTAWTRSYVQGYAAQRPNNYGSLIFMDREPECQDSTASGGSTGSALAICLLPAEGLHILDGGAQMLGLKAARTLAGALGIYGYSFSTSLTDVYDAVNNPTGVLNADALFTGATASTGISAPCTGLLPGSWLLIRYAGSATGTPCAASVEGPNGSPTTRTDLYSGSRVVLTTSVGSGTNNEGYFLLETYPLSTLNVTAGTDTIQATVPVEFSNLANLEFASLDINCLNSGSTNIFEAVDTGGGTTNLLPASTALDGMTPSTPTVFQTPPFVCPAATTQLQVIWQWVYNGSGAAASATGTIKLGGIFIRKVF